MLFLPAILFGQNSSIEDLVDRGNKLYDVGKYIDAVAEYQQALSIDKNAPAPNYEIANTYLALEKYDKAIYYSDKVISLNKEFVDKAYTLKGTAQDLMQQHDAALETYKEGIKHYPNYYLLNYNLALDLLNKKQYPYAAYYSSKAIQEHPQHAGSHLILATCMYQEGQRIPAILAYYYFLLLEPGSKRSEGALAILNKLLRNGISKEGDKKTNDEFVPADAALSLLASQQFGDKNADQPEYRQFYEVTNSFFKMMYELSVSKKIKDIWWDFYVPFFDNLQKSDNMEAYCYYISQSGNNAVVKKWVKDNQSSVEKLAQWYEVYY